MASMTEWTIDVPDMMPFHKCDTWEDAILLIYAIGLGKIMIAEKDWHGDKPWAGPKAIRYQPQAKASTQPNLICKSMRTP